ncbi:MAG: sulfur carrier protein ThiS adenylyltransferase ThiF [Caloramator sp.]|nr:sulfur carrier protein ThiS adenylyltransferase ThiF [Caloramator sp.]
MNENILLNYLTLKQIDKIKNTSITIVGCGGLGSNISKILIRTGFENLTLIDFDYVEEKNLIRQDYCKCHIGMLKTQALKENLLQINEKSNLEIINIKINEKNIDILKSADIVVEAVDDVHIKRTIFEFCINYNIKIVSASGIAGFGDCENIKIKRGKNFSIVGDFKKSVENFSPLMPKVCAVASIQADEVLRMVIGDEV